MSDVSKDDLRQDWVDHPYAGIVKKHGEHLLAVARGSLRVACTQSTDPKVRAAQERVTALEQAMELVAKGVT